MEPEVDEPRPLRELRVEGIGLAVLAAGLLVLLAAAFYLGLRVGRSEAEGGAAAVGRDVGPEEITTAPPVDGYFDQAPAEGAAEPAREAAPPPAPPAPASPPAAAPAAGSWVVQVFAGRDRKAAESLVRNLSGRGYPVKIDSQRDGRETLYKVRVGGYPTQDAARQAADRLRKDGESGAWVTRVP